MDTQSWVLKFPNSIVYSVEATTYDHLPIFLDSIPQQQRHLPKRFRFENSRLHEDGCGEVVQSYWQNSTRKSIQVKIKDCGQDQIAWGDSQTKIFPQNIVATKQLMAQYRGKEDSLSVKEFF